MKRLLLLIALLLPLGVLGQPILRNSLTTNTLDTNLVYYPTTRTLAIEGTPGSVGAFQVLSNGIISAKISGGTGVNLLQSLNLATYLSLSGQTNRLTISTTNTLLLDGQPIVTGNSALTNTVINATTINVTTQIFNTAKGAHVVVSNSFTIVTNATFALQNLPRPSVLIVPADGNVTNATLSGLTLSGTTLTATGGGVSTAVTTLAYSGATNITGFDCSTNGSAFKLTLTNNAYIGGTNVVGLQAATSYMTYTLQVQNNTTGLYTLTFDPTIFAWAEGVQPVKTTNASSADVYYFHTHLFTNSMLVGSMNQNVK